MAGNTSPFGYDVPVWPEPENAKRKYFSQEHVDWFLEQQQRTNVSPQRLGSVTLTEQNASIGATSLPLTDLSAGYYRISYYTRITTVDGVSSSLTVTFQWTDGAVSPSQSGVAITGNTTTTQQNGTLFVRADANAAITYATTYVSNTPGQMKYRLDIVVERLPT